MPVTLTQIAKKIAHARMAFDDGADLNVTYYPLQISDEMFLQLQSFGDATESTMGGLLTDLNDMLVQVVATWDLLEEDGQTVIPLTVERLQKLSPVIKAMVVQCILSSIGPEALAPQTMS